MTTHQEQLQDLREIRSLMERSSRFIGLSGLSGVAAGACALIGIAAVYEYVGMIPFVHNSDLPYYTKALHSQKWGLHYQKFIILAGILTVVSAFLMGFFFTTRRALQKGQAILDKTALRLVFHLGIPLVAGGLCCLAMLFQGGLAFVAPATLIFYGLALVNGSKYTLHDVLYLGLMEIGLGVCAMFLLAYGLEFWAMGFGVLHIVYGSMMYFKYER